MEISARLIPSNVLFFPQRMAYPTEASIASMKRQASRFGAMSMKGQVFVRSRRPASS